MRKKLPVITAFIILSCSLWAEQALTFVTINVWSGLTNQGVFKSGSLESREERSFRYGLLVNAIRELDADVIAVNEANMLPGYAKKLARDLDYDFIYAVRFGGVRLGQAGFPINLREGEAILAKKHLYLAMVGTRGLSGGYAGNFASFHVRDATRVLAGKITLGERDVYLFNTHWKESEFSSGPQLREMVDTFAADGISSSRLIELMQDAMSGHETRAMEAAETLDYVDEVCAGRAAVLMGTLGALPDSPEIALVKESGFTDAWSGNRDAGYTRDGLINTNIMKYHDEEQNGRAPVRARVDYIFIRGDGVRAKSSKIVFEKATYDTHASDHFGVLAVIEF